MRLLFLGDMVGRSGRTAVWEKLPGLISDLKLDFVIVNGENAAGGFGITEDIAADDFYAGGTSSPRRQPCLGPARGARQPYRRATRASCVRLNFPARRAGARRHVTVEARNGRACWSPTSWAASSWIPSDDPFQAVAARTRPPVRSAELGRRGGHRHPCRGDQRKSGDRHFADGRASLVVGTHSHVPTADRAYPAGRHRPT
jgi:hypothetical protein